jgi:hypothetical protein
VQLPQIRQAEHVHGGVDAVHPHPGVGHERRTRLKIHGEKLPVSVIQADQQHG